MARASCGTRSTIIRVDQIPPARARANARTPSAGREHEIHIAHDGRAEPRVQLRAQLALDELQLLHPFRAVDADDEHAAAELRGTRVRGDRRTHGGAPLGPDGIVDQARRGREACECRTQRLAEKRYATARRHARTARVALFSGIDKLALTAQDMVVYQDRHPTYGYRALARSRARVKRRG